jgi:hypothetical protein
LTWRTVFIRLPVWKFQPLRLLNIGLSAAVLIPSVQFGHVHTVFVLPGT